MNYYKEKDSTYFSEYREDIFNVIKAIGRFDRVMEVGCGNGALLSKLKEEQIAKTIVGLDPYGQLPLNNNFDEFYNDSIENVLPKLKNNLAYDLIIFADVLEHLEDPWSVLNKICKDHLTDGGTVVISIPNFRNLFTISKIIISNSFKYQPEGVLDKTHLRFFCKNDLIKLVEGAGLEVKLLTQNFKFKEAKFFHKNRLKYINYFTLNIFPFWVSDQIIAIAQKNGK